jgi:hypothetical protein
MNSICSSKASLTSEQLEHYRREGYIIYKRPVFSEQKFDMLRFHFNEKVANLPSHVRPESMDVPHFTDTKLFDWLFSEEVLDLVEPILGPDIALFSSHFICKPKGDGKRVPWHEDSAYWKGILDPMEVVTVWLAIDPSTKENGCMYVIPRTHGHGFSDYGPVDPTKNVFKNEILPSQRDDSKAIACELAPNECSLHNAKLMHGSEPNTSNIRRCGYTMRYISTAVKFDEEKHGIRHHIYLARGRDLAGNQYGDPSKTYQEKVEYRRLKGKSLH